MSKTVAIIGASRGIGCELVKQFAQQGYLVLAYSRNILRMREQFSHLDNVTSFALDLSCDQVRQNFEETIKNVDGIDILINNAGTLVNKPFTQLSHQDLTYSYQVNVIAPMQVVQGALAKMNKGAHIVNISSVGGVEGSVKFPGLCAYSTSKAALVSFTELFSEEYKEHDIAMNCLALGAVQTEMLEEAFPGYQAPLNPDEMATYILDFAQKAHKYMKGKIISVSLTTP